MIGRNIMIVKLNETVKIREFADIIVLGAANKCECLSVEFTFSKDALLGLATNLIWMHEDINPQKKLHVHIEPLRGNVPGNQALGFFLTPQSPAMVLNVNSNNDNSVIDLSMENYKEIPIKYKFIKEFEIKEPAENEAIEDYELGFNNLAQIRILDSNKSDITNSHMQVIININYIGLKDFANMILILANNFETEQEYMIAHIKKNEQQYNMGILLSEISNQVVFKCGHLGSVYNYDPNFGKL